MPRRTKEELRLIRNEKRLDDLVLSNRYLRESVYHKNNYWSWAAWDSWAAQGKAGSCPCGCGYYNGTLHNRRKSTKRGGGKVWLPDVTPNLCSTCIDGIEKRLNIKFKRH